MVWKKVANSDAGDADHFGGDDLDKVSDLLSGTDVDDVDINSDFTIRSSKLNLRNPANTFSLTFVNPPITANSTTVWSGPGSYYIFKDPVDNLYKAKDMHNMNLLSTTSATDCSLVLQAAITALSSGGHIIYSKGTFPHLTAVLCTTSGIQISGTSRATKWTVTPGSALTNFLSFGSCFDCKVRDLWIQGSTDVVNLIRCYGSTAGVGCNAGEISGCLLDGTTKTSGHHGIWMDGALVAVPGDTAVFEWNIYKNRIINEDFGIYLTPPQSNAQYIYGNTFATCNVGIEVEAVDECMIWGNLGQTLSTAVVRLNNLGGTSASTYNTIWGIQGDGAVCPVVELTAGCKYNSVTNIVETGGVRILDNSGEKNFLQPGTLFDPPTVTVTASPFTYQNTLGYPVMMYVKGGIVSDISHKRAPATTTSLFSDTDQGVRLDGGDSIIVTYQVAPTMKAVPAG